LDNASWHKSQELKELFEKSNVQLLFLPPYSPELNPIEQIWGNMKEELRGYYDNTITLFENISLVVNKRTEFLESESWGLVYHELQTSRRDKYGRYCMCHFRQYKQGNVEYKDSCTSKKYDIFDQH
jgi:hypothetical protein